VLKHSYPAGVPITQQAWRGLATEGGVVMTRARPSPARIRKSERRTGWAFSPQGLPGLPAPRSLSIGKSQRRGPKARAPILTEQLFSINSPATFFLPCVAKYREDGKASLPTAGPFWQLRSEIRPRRSAEDAAAGRLHSRREPQGNEEVGQEVPAKKNPAAGKGTRRGVQQG
jgi:hypothetical protein